MARIGTITMDSVGYGYDSSPVVTISKPNMPILKPVVQATLDSASTTITGVGISVSGSHYIITPSVTLSSPTDSSNKQALVTSSVSSNKVSGLTITNSGKFYSDSSGVVLITISPPTGDSDKQATLSLQYDSVNDKVSGLTITNQGKLYDSSSPPIITISTFDSIGGSNASAVATTVNNRLSSVLITDSGSGYTSKPTVTVSAPTLSLSDFTATATTIIVNNRLDSAIISDSGDFYSSPPSITVSPPTKNATNFTATAIAVMNQIDSGNSIQAITMTSNGMFYTSIPTVTVDSATGDSNHFRATGFATVNSSNRSITGIGIVKAGKYYDSNVTPIVTVAPPTLAKFEIGEKITHKLPNTTLHGEVSAYNSVSSKMSLIHVGAEDGQYHNFVPNTDSDIIGANNGSKVGIIRAVEVNKISSNEQNEEFAANVSGTTLDFLDFSETNPFGDPGDE